MKGKFMHGFVPAAGLLASITCFGADAPQPAAQTLYRIADLPGLGGTNSAGNSINDTRLVAGYSNLPGDQTRHATAWLHGLPFDLGTLGGPNSNVAWPVKNKRGLIAGIAETAQPDPLGEAWSCSAFFPTTTHQQCLGFAWQLGRMRALPTLGGNNGFATGVDNHGRIVGWAENTVHDPTCNPPQVLQFRAVIWGPEPDRIQELPPLEGDTVSSATAINADGQIAGISGICSNAVGEYSAAHAVVWRNGQPRDLGNIGGVAWNTPMAINNAGVVVGFANVPGAPDPADFNAHAFVWTQAAGMQDIHGFPEDAFSQALGINARGQVVGLSCTAGFASCRAFIWENGVMSDLNDRIEGDYANHLFFANDINDFGEISGQLVDAVTGESRTFVAVPSSRTDDGEGLAARTTDHATRAGALPEDVRRTLVQQLGLGRTDL